jgi:hypothetical protein
MGKNNHPVKSQTSACVAYAENQHRQFYPASEKHIKNRAEWEKSIKEARARIGL